MTIQEVALRAAEFFQYPREGSFERTNHRSALIGFFNGVASGQITEGQDWPVRILLDETRLSSPAHYNLLQEIFESGICCAGQPLTSARRRQSGR